MFEKKGEWRQIKLSDVAEIDRKVLGSSTDPDYSFRYISLSNVETGKIVGPLRKLLFSAAPSRARRVVRDGDVLISTVRPNLLGFTLINRAHEDCIASTGFAVVSSGPDLLSEYLFQYMFSRSIQAQLHALVVGSNYPAINSVDVSALRIVLPSLDEQRRIADALGTWDVATERIRALEAATLRQKRGLLQAIFSERDNPHDPGVSVPSQSLDDRAC